MAIIRELTEKGESGSCTKERRSQSIKRIIDTDDYRGALDGSDTDVPKLGDAYPGIAEMTVTRLDIKGMLPVANVDGAPDYKQARITVGYSNMALETDGQGIHLGAHIGPVAVCQRRACLAWWTTNPKADQPADL